MLLLSLSSVAVRLVSEKSGEYGAKTCSSESFRRCSSDSSGVLESDIIAMELSWEGLWHGVTKEDRYGKPILSVVIVEEDNMLVKIIQLYIGRCVDMRIDE